jgi:hypothetical protein
MTQEEKRIKLAEAGGWTKVHQSWTGQKKACIPNDSQILPLPDYFTDLNAVHELEKVLTDEQWLEYREELRTAILGGIRLVSQWCKADLHATAAQRCEALGITLNLWKQ